MKCAKPGTTLERLGLGLTALPAKLQRVLDAVGSGLRDVVNVMVHLQDINDFAVLNEVCAMIFPKPYPSGAAVQSILGAGVFIHLDAYAVGDCGANKQEWNP